MNFEEVAILPAEVKKAWLKSTLKSIKNLINNKTFPMEYLVEVEPLTLCMYVYKSKIQSDGGFYKLKLIIVARG